MDGNQDFKLNIPVLLIAYNRPDTTAYVFSKIRASKPCKLYVAVDGAKQTKKEDSVLVDQVKTIVKNVDWPCDKHYRFNERNLGAEITVSSAISWAFENEEYLIILEDDIVAPISFFKFAQEMLIKYKNNHEIGTITGSNFTPLFSNINTDYIFAKYGHSWGWATWKRFWNGFDLNVKIPSKHLKMSFLKQITNSNAEAKYYKKRFHSIKTNGIGNSTWDNIALYQHRVNRYLSIIPRVNLTSNIGIFGLHTKGQTESHYLDVDEDFIVRKHPDKIECFTEYDIHHFNNYINKKYPYCKRIVRKITKLLSLN